MPARPRCVDCNRNRQTTRGRTPFGTNDPWTAVLPYQCARSVCDDCYNSWLARVIDAYRPFHNPNAVIANPRLNTAPVYDDMEVDEFTGQTFSRSAYREATARNEVQWVVTRVTHPPGYRARCDDDPIGIVGNTAIATDSDGSEDPC